MGAEKKEKQGSCPGCGSSFTFPAGDDLTAEEKMEIKRELAEIKAMLASRKKAKTDALEDMDDDEADSFTAEERRFLGLPEVDEEDDD